MIPIKFVKEGESVKIIKLALSEEFAKRMREIGLVSGNKVTVIKNDGKCIIISIGESRFALDNSLAGKIMVRE